MTNWHVAVRGGFSVIRLNTHSGPPDILEFGPEDWEFDASKGYDIAVVQVPLKTGFHKNKFNDVSAFVTPEIMSSIGIGPGDDVFMLGRFIDHDGGPTNVPAARFGNVSINPAPIVGALGKPVDTFCLDMNSRTGYSGSPVFIYRTFVTDLEELIKDEHQGKLLLAAKPTILLLGVHTGQFQEWWPFQKGTEEAALERQGAQIKGLSGMTCCAPAWQIRELLDRPKLKSARDAAETLLEQMKSGVRP